MRRVGIHGADDGYEHALVPGLRSSADADRLASEVALAAARLSVLASRPPGLYAEVASAPDRAEAAWLAFLIAALGPLDAADPWPAITAVRGPWREAASLGPAVNETSLGPRAASDPARAIAAYRAWVERAGSQEAGLAGDAGWSPERRFARAYERLALPGLGRDARFELLVSLGRLGVVELRAGGLQLGGEDDVTVAAKRVWGIGDPLLLDRRARALAEAGEVELEAFDLGLWNWSRGARYRGGIGEEEEDLAVRERLGAVLGLAR